MAQRLMWSFFVVLLHPLLGLLSDFAQLLKHKHVEHRFAVAAIKPLDETILHRLAWFDELEHHAMLLGPVSQGHGNELRSLVQPQVGGNSRAERRSTQACAPRGRLVG